MDTIVLVIVAILLIIISAWFTQKSRPRNALPGPAGLPIVGYLPFMTNKPYVKFHDLSKKYGPVYKVRLGSKDLVIICDFKLIKEAFADDAFMGRPGDIPFEISETTIRTGAMLGMPWKEQRRFSLMSLRDLGFGKTRMEEQLKEEILEMMQLLEETKGKPFQMSTYLAPSASNNIASLLFGKRLKSTDPRRKELDKLFAEVGLYAGAVSWQLFFPWIRNALRYLNLGNNYKLAMALGKVRNYCQEELDEHEATFDPNNIRDFMDRYFIEIEKNKNNENSTFQRDVLLDLSRAFFGAGSETIRVTLDWIFLIVAEYQHIQKKINNEIDEVLGRERFPTWQDRLDMPYTEAVICETMRWKSIVALNIMRLTLKDTELNGYFIPNDSNVLAVLYSPDHDEKLWGKDVHEFKPERFLSPDGKKVIKPEFFIPFSIGKRSCPGKILAEIEIFLFTTAILQKFKLSMPPGKKADFEEVLGIGLQPKRQNVCIEKR